MKRARDGRWLRVQAAASVRPGPASLDGSLDIFDYTATGLRRHMSYHAATDAVTDAVRSKLDRGYVLTSSYAGTGSDLAVGRQTVRAVEKLLGLEPTPNICHSAWENWKVAQRCRASHVGRSRPNHVVPDILDRLF